MNLRNVGDSKFTAHHTVLVEMYLHLKPRFSRWVVHKSSLRRASCESKGLITKRLSVVCTPCGCVHDRDINGAINILFKRMFIAMRDPSTPCLV